MMVQRRLQALRAASVVLAFSVLGMPASAASCGDHLAALARQQAQGDGYTVAFAPSIWPIPVGHHFGVDLVLCPPPNTETPVSIAVDADMPAHRHGMNYRATVRALGNGRFRAEGLMFHMPGRWRFIFDIGTGAQTVRVTREVDVQ